MANICEVNYKIVGKKENVDLMLEALEQKKDVYVGRGMLIEENPDFEDLDNGKVACEGFAGTKWSIRSSLLDDAIRMRENPEKWYFGENINPNDLTFLTLDEASAKYNVDVEMYSTEIGCCFAEHYLIRNGSIEINECVPYFEIPDGEELDFEFGKEIEEQLGREITEDELECGIIGGFGDDEGIYDWEI